MKRKYTTLVICFTILLLGCSKRNFFPDQDDPGLSRFTSRGYNIAAMYINNVPYINTFKKPIFGGVVNTVPTVTLLRTSSDNDTLAISWQIEVNDSSNFYNNPYYSVSLLMPVQKNFTSGNFIGMNGQRFASNTNAIALNSYSNNPASLTGKSNIYFVNIQYTDSSANSTRSYSFSGLFDGNIGDSILITKGRFDFKIDASQIRF